MKLTKLTRKCAVLVLSVFALTTTLVGEGAPVARQRGCALAWGEITGAYNVVRDEQHEHNIAVYVTPDYWFTMDVDAYANRNTQNTPLEIVNVGWALQGTSLSHYEVDPNDPTKITVHTTSQTGIGAVWAFVQVRTRNGSICSEEISSYIYVQMPY